METGNDVGSTDTNHVMTECGNLDLYGQKIETLYDIQKHEQL